MRRSSVHPHRVSQRHCGWNQISPIWTPDRRTNFHRSNVDCSCFLAQASLFLLLVSFIVGFFAAIRPWMPDSHSLLWTVDVEMRLLLELSEAFIWTEISEAGNSNELNLCSRGNSESSIPVAVLMRASFITALDGFCDCTWRNFQSSWNVPDYFKTWLSVNDGLSFLFAYLSCSCHNMDLVFYQIGLSFVYSPYRVTTQLIGSNALRSKEIPQINF